MCNIHSPDTELWSDWRLLCLGQYCQPPQILRGRGSSCVAFSILHGRWQIFHLIPPKIVYKQKYLLVLTLFLLFCVYMFIYGINHKTMCKDEYWWIMGRFRISVSSKRVSILCYIWFFENSTAMLWKHTNRLGWEQEG